MFPYDSGIFLLPKKGQTNECRIYRPYGRRQHVVNAARVSFAKEASNYTDKQNERLISYLARHSHWTPFAHAFISLRFKAPIAIHAQCVKHQIGFAMNTVSRRYVSDEPEYFLPTFRKKAKNIKQGSGEVITTIDASGSVSDDKTNGIWSIRRNQAELQEIYSDFLEEAIALYNEFVYLGVAPEQARFILPQGVMTEWVWSGSLQAFARFYNQRIDPHAQQEIRQLAEQVDDIISPLFPISWQALTGDKDVFT